LAVRWGPAKDPRSFTILGKGLEERNRVHERRRQRKSGERQHSRKGHEENRPRRKRQSLGRGRRGKRRDWAPRVRS